MGNLRLRCALGRGGIGAPRREGDGRTPAGAWPVLAARYRADRLPRPACVLPLSPIRASDGWCDAPDDRNYNRAVRLPYPASAERMARGDALYDVVLVLDCNLTRRARRRGSAIFVHCAAAGYAPTAGCVALARADLLRLARRLRRGDRFVIRAGGAG